MKGDIDTSHQKFHGFQSPNTTPVPDEFFDDLLAVLSGAEVKVVLYICRRTFGWKKDSDNISLNQMLRGITKKDGTRLDGGVGLSKPTLLRSLKILTEKHVILAEQRDSKEKGHEPTNYRLNLRDTLGQKMTLGLSQNFTKPLVKKSASQETIEQETGDNTVSNGEGSILQNLPHLPQPQARTAYVTDLLLKQLKDTHSKPFYRLIAAKVPEQVIRQALAELKADGAREPAKLFTHKMKLYALQERKKRVGE